MYVHSCRCILFCECLVSIKISKRIGIRNGIGKLIEKKEKGFFIFFLPSSFRPAGLFPSAPAQQPPARAPPFSFPVFLPGPAHSGGLITAAAALPASTAVAPSAADSPGPQVSAIPHLCPAPGPARHGRNRLRAHVRIVGAPPRAPASTKWSPRPSRPLLPLQNAAPWMP